MNEEDKDDEEDLSVVIVLGLAPITSDEDDWRDSWPDGIVSVMLTDPILALWCDFVCGLWLGEMRSCVDCESEGGFRLQFFIIEFVVAIYKL